MATKGKVGKARRPAYLTKRVLVSAASKGIRKAADRTMATMGYIIVAQDGWIVKKYPNNTFERLEKIEQPVNVPFHLD